MDLLLSPLACPLFIGRAAERDALRTLVDLAREGSGQAALVSGEPGIGKSRLIAEASADAARLGFLTLVGHCSESESTLPYAPLLDLLRTCLTRPPVDDTTRAIPLPAPLAHLLPEWSSGPTTSNDTQVDKRHVFASITRYVSELAAQRPVLLAMEDIHWGDDLSLEYLLYLTRHCRHMPLLLVATARVDEAASAARRWLAQLHRERLAHEITLAPLTRAEVGQMATALLPAGGIVGMPLLDTLYARSEGNPFFIEELLRALISTRALVLVNGIWQGTSAGSPVPRSVQEVVHQQTEQLSADAKRVLAASAVGGREIDYRLLRAVLGLEDKSLVPLLKEVIAAQMLIEEDSDRYAFRHALHRDAICSELLGLERVSLHRAFGEAIEALYPEGQEREAYLSSLAAHYTAAGEWAKALTYAERAARQALTLHAPHATLENITRAEKAADQLGMPVRAELAYLRGQAHETLGEFEPARESYERALALTQAEDALALESQCLLALGFLWAGREYSQAGQWFDRALHLAEQARDNALLAQSLNRYGNWLANTGRSSESLEAHQRALRLFEALDDVSGRAASLDLLGTAYGMTGDRVAATEHLGQAIELFAAQGDQQSLCTSLAMRAIQSSPGSSETTCCPLRPPDACLLDATDALRLARQIRSLPAEVFAENALAHTLLAFGEYGAALAHMQAGRRIASEIEHQQWIIATSYGLGLIYADLGAIDDAITELTACREQASVLGSAFWSATVAAHLGLAHARNGDLPAAVGTLRSALPDDRLPGTVAERSVALAWGHMLLLLGEPTRSLAIADQLLISMPGRVPDVAPQPIPHLLLLRGEALLALGRTAEAASALEAARHGARQRHARPLLWTIHRALGRAYRSQRFQKAARREESTARSLIESLAASVEEAQLRERFQRVALASLPPERSLSTAQRAKQAFGGLTAREREVAALIAHGATSREIARALTISERTAEAHVSHVLDKLGFSSRAQIAAWAVARGLVEA
ncbi:MAG TPA: AAA family ATPase [Ktedonobacterales bacterium]